MPTRARRACPPARPAPPPPPAASRPKTSYTDRSKSRAETARQRSASVTPKRALRSSIVLTAVRCGSSTPFGSPVEPEVNRMYASDSSPSGGGAGAISGRARGRRRAERLGALDRDLGGLAQHDAEPAERRMRERRRAAARSRRARTCRPPPARRAPRRFWSGPLGRLTATVSPGATRASAARRRPAAPGRRARRSVARPSRPTQRGAGRDGSPARAKKPSVAAFRCAARPWC